MITFDGKVYKSWPELSIEERIHRWETCVRVMRNLPKETVDRHFFMNTWGRKHECGTNACAAGFLALDPEIQEMGMIFFEVRYGDGNAFIIGGPLPPRVFVGNWAYENIFTNPVFIKEHGYKGYLVVLQAMENYLDVLKKEQQERM